MELILIRHGIAETRESFEKKGLEDHLRPLTERGRKRVQRVSFALREQIKSLDVIVSSPYTRTRQTAEMFSQIFDETKVLEASELVPEATPMAFVKWLKTQGRRYQRLAVVGHEPSLSTLASYLVTGVDESFMDLKKGGMICLHLNAMAGVRPGDARLLWVVPPRFFLKK